MRHVTLLLVAVASAAAPTLAFAQISRPASQPILRQASLRNGVIRGIVRDDAGQAVGGVDISAFGTDNSFAKTDLSGRFNLTLVPGTYQLRAARSGYVSTYNEMVRIGASAQLERAITITRQPAIAGRPVLIASTSTPGVIRDSAGVSGEKAKDADHPHTDMVWLLRRMPRTILRDGSGVPATTRAGDFRFLPSFLDWAVGESTRLAGSFLFDTDFSGQLNFLTTSALDGETGWRPNELPRGIAYVSVSAPVGTHGDWSIRGATTPGDLSSWAVLGEYQARAAQTHAFRVGMSYSAQLAAKAGTASLMPIGDGGRNAGSAYGYDVWRVRPGLEVDYGISLDRYGYVSGQQFLSSRVGGRVRVADRTFATARASQQMVAPGADEFLPPSSAGPWLPAERTFAPLVPGSGFHAERVRHYQVGVEREFGVIGLARRVSLSRFRQQADDQIATMFDTGRGVGHYYVATPGDVVVDGWIVGLAGALMSRVNGQIHYTVNDAKWSQDLAAPAIAAVLPMVIRPARERLHDVSTSLEANIRETDTRVLVAYRFSTGFRATSLEEPRLLNGRFDVSVRQALPFQPLRGGKIEVLLAVRSLFREGREAGSIYDELLTVSPPMRVMGGFQVRF